MKRQRKERSGIVAEYLVGDASFRELEAKYGISTSTLHRWVKAYGRQAGNEGQETGGQERSGQERSVQQRAVQKAGQEEEKSRSIRERPTSGEILGSGKRSTGGEPVEEDLAAEVRRLRGELERSELHNKLLNAMIDIAEDKFEIPIRKKRGARQ